MSMATRASMRQTSAVTPSGLRPRHSCTAALPARLLLSNRVAHSRMVIVNATVKEEVASLFDRWNAALQTGDAEKVAKLYHQDAILLPTISNQVRTTPKAIKEYFGGPNGFLAQKPNGRITERVIQEINPNLAVDSGSYVFQTINGEAKARYTFTYARENGGDWMIKYHHSSLQPEMAADLGLVQIQFDRWNSALKSGDPKKVAELYAPDGVLLATASPKLRVGREDIENYFMYFLSLKPEGTIIEGHVQLLCDTLASYSGVYSFKTAETVVPARFSFLYGKMHGQWLIKEHHSSAMPQKYEPEVLPQAQVKA